jgi:predicted nucleic acid-binding protein
MIVVSDTTAITTLLKAGKEDLLQQSFKEVLVPQAVWNELLAFHRILPDFIILRPTVSGERFAGAELLGMGEAEAIMLAKETGAELFLTDDRKARAAAMRLGIKCSGLAGLLVRAKQANQISSVREWLVILESKGGLYCRILSRPRRSNWLARNNCTNKSSLIRKHPLD